MEVILSVQVGHHILPRLTDLKDGSTRDSKIKRVRGRFRDQSWGDQKLVTVTKIFFIKISYYLPIWVFITTGVFYHFYRGANASHELACYQFWSRENLAWPILVTVTKFGHGDQFWSRNRPTTHSYDCFSDLLILSPINDGDPDTLDECWMISRDSRMPKTRMDLLAMTKTSQKAEKKETR